MMNVSMILIRFELPEISSMKEKRSLINSIKQRLFQQFHISCAEVDLMDSAIYGVIGGAYVSNSRKMGEIVMNKVLAFMEGKYPVRIKDVKIHTEIYN